MKLIVGLGNPGRKYRNHRHNIGYISLDRIVRHLDIKVNKRKFNSRYTLYAYKDKQIIFVKPLTYMNLSGSAIKSFVTFFNISIFDDMFVIVDDVNLPFGKIRIRKQGSAGGHNGIQSIIDSFGTNRFIRLRVGIDKPSSDLSLKSYVLSSFTSEEKKALPTLLDQIKDACICWLEEGITTVMQRYN